MTLFSEQDETEEVTESAQEAALDRVDAIAGRFEGRFVSVVRDKLVIISKSDEKCFYTLAKDAKLTCDGTVCNAEHLKRGIVVRVTTDHDDRYLVNAVECLENASEFADRS